MPRPNAPAESSPAASRHRQRASNVIGRGARVSSPYKVRRPDRLPGLEGRLAGVRLAVLSA